MKSNLFEIKLIFIVKLFLLFFIFNLKTIKIIKRRTILMYKLFTTPKEDVENK